MICILSCQKEISSEGFSGNGTGQQGGTATFTLVPAGSNCSDATVSGTFEEGTVLSIDATIIVTVNVTKAGDWNYTTSLINGFAFAGAGVFTATGSQSITLQGVGTPAKTGSSIIPLNIGGATCSVTVTVVPKGTAPTSDIYYKATIDGVNYTQSVTLTNDYEAGSGLGGVDDVFFGAGINYANPPVPAGLTEMGISKGIMHNYLTATDAAFKAFFAPGDYPYSPNSSTDGVTVSWTSPTGEFWDSGAGTGVQTGSTFKIISVEDAYDITGTYYIKVKMQFACKLYNVSTGAVKDLKNGEMVAYFGKI